MAHAQYKLYAEIQPELATGFEHKVGVLLKRAFRNTKANIALSPELHKQFKKNLQKELDHAGPFNLKLDGKHVAKDLAKQLKLHPVEITVVATNQSLHKLSQQIQASLSHAHFIISPTLSPAATHHIQQQLNGLGGSFGNFKPSVNTSGLLSGFDKAGERAGKMFVSGFKYAAMGLGAALTGIVAASGFGLKIAANNEAASITFETFLGSAQKAKKFWAGLVKFAAETPFELPGLQEASIQLLGAGVAADDIIPMLRNLGDMFSSMPNGIEKMDRAMFAIRQILAAGKLKAQDVNQLVQAGIPVYEIISKATGKSTKEIAAMGAAGKFTKKEFDALFKAFKTGKGIPTRFTGLMKKQSETLIGLWSTLKDNLGQGLAKAMEPAIPKLKKFMADIAKLAPGVFKEASRVFKWTIDQLDKGYLWVKKNWPAIKKLWADNISTPFSKFVKEYGPKVQAFFKTLTEKISKLDPVKTRETATNIVKIAGALKLASLMGKNPIMTLLTMMAYKYPKQTQDVISGITSSLSGVIDFMSKHPKTIRDLLLVLAAYKGLSVIKGFKFPKFPTWAGGQGGAAGALQKVSISAPGLGSTAANPLWVKFVGKGAAAAPTGTPTPIVTPLGGAAKAKNFAKALGGGLLRVGGGLLIADIVLTLFGTDLQTELKGLWDEAPWQKGSQANKDWIAFGKWLDEHGVMPANQHSMKDGWGGQLEEMKHEWGSFVNFVRMDGTLDTWISGIATKINGIFGIGGSIDKSLHDFGSSVNGIFGVGGSIDTALHTFFGQTIPALWSGAYEGFMRNFGSPVNNWVMVTFPGYFVSAKNWVVQKWGEIWGGFTSHIVAPMSNWITVSVPGYWESFKTSAGGAWESFTAKFNSVKSSIGSFFTTSIPGWVSGAITAVSTSVTTIANGLITKINAVIPGDKFDLPGFSTGGVLDVAAVKSGNSAVKRRSRGGGVWGAGTATSDSIPAMLSNGEYVIRAKAAQTLGPQMLNAMNWADKGMAFAKGGLVDFGHYLQSLGARVSENPSFGGVHGGHAKNSLHYSGNAIDVNYGPGGESAQEKAFFDKIVNSGVYKDYGLRAIWRVAGHFNHAHFDTGKSGSMLGKLGSALGIGNPFTALLDSASSAMAGNGWMGGIGAGAVEGLRSYLGSKIGSWFGSGDTGSNDTGSAPSGSNQSIGRAMLAKFGFGDGEWGALQKLWTGESGWRTDAKNPSSGAYGIPQSLPGSKMASAGKDWRTNPATQIKWGLGYIKGRYGSPSKAYAAWQARSPHWYSKGGPVGYANGGLVGEIGKQEKAVRAAVMDGAVGGISKAHLATLKSAPVSLINPYAKTLGATKATRLYHNLPKSKKQSFLNAYKSFIKGKKAKKPTTKNLKSYTKSALSKMTKSQLAALARKAAHLKGGEAKYLYNNIPANMRDGFNEAIAKELGVVDTGSDIGSGGGSSGTTYLDALTGTTKNLYQSPLNSDFWLGESDKPLSSTQLRDMTPFFNEKGKQIFSELTASVSGYDGKLFWDRNGVIRGFGEEGGAASAAYAAAQKSQMDARNLTTPAMRAAGPVFGRSSNGTVELSPGTLSMLAGLIHSRPANLSVGSTQMASYNDDSLGRYITSGI